MLHASHPRSRQGHNNNLLNLHNQLRSCMMPSHISVNNMKIHSVKCMLPPCQCFLVYLTYHRCFNSKHTKRIGIQLMMTYRHLTRTTWQSFKHPSPIKQVVLHRTDAPKANNNNNNNKHPRQHSSTASLNRKFPLALMRKFSVNLHYHHHSDLSTLNN